MRAGDNSVKTLENKAKQQETILSMEVPMESRALTKPGDLTTRQQNFARLYAETGVALQAYMVAYDCEGSSRATARVNAFRLLRNPKVAARVRALQEAAAERSLRSTASLIHDLEAMVECDPNELVRLDVGPCRHCHGIGGAYQWRDYAEYLAALTQALNDGSALPSDAGGVVFNSTADVSPGARKLLRGIELFPDGTVKRVLLHDQAALRIELHRLRGLHVERSLNVNVNTNVPAMPKTMSVEQALELLSKLAPVPADADDTPDDSDVVSVDP
jgi:hypothetical protein